MRRVALFWLCGSCLFGQPASIDGIAVNALNGEPMPGVHVRLVARDFESATRAYGALSAAGGRFSISAIEPGAYTLMPEFRGFLYLGKPAPQFAGIVLKPGQHLADFKLEMTPHAVIIGRVLDDYGDPVANVSVQAEAIAKDAPRAAMMGSRAATNDRGEFRLAGAPGKYRLKATPWRMGNFGSFGAETRTDGSSAAPFGPTYYPSTAAVDRAGVVEVAAGSQTNAIEIRLLRGQRGITISGIVSGIPQDANPTVWLQSGENLQKIFSTQGMGTQSDGKFTFRGLEPKFYRLFADCSSCKPPAGSQPMEFKLESDITSLHLALEPAGDLNGTLEVAGGQAAGLTVRLAPAQGVHDRKSPSAQVSKDGSFHLAGVMPARYRVHIEPLPENAYVRSIQLDGTPASKETLDLSRGSRGSQAKIVISMNGGQVTGKVLDADGQTLPGGMAAVTLVHDADFTDARFARPSSEGQYTLHGVPPGKYRLVATSLFPTEDSDRKALFAAAKEFEIKEGDRITKDIKIAAKEGGDAKP